MTTFWLVASGLIAAALLLVLPPLLRRRQDAPHISRKATNVAVYRDQLRELERDMAGGVITREGYEEARAELERRLLEDVSDTEEAVQVRTASRNAAVVIGAVLPVAAFALYFAVGNFQALIPGASNRVQEQAHSIGEEQIRQLTARLAARLEKEPDDIQGWIMLGRSYTALGQFKDAARAYGSAVARSGSDAALLADYADALAMAQGRSLQGEPEKIVHRALAVDPQNVKALALAGTAAFDRRDYAGAVQFWERILKNAPEDSEFAKAVRGSIAEARQLAGTSGEAVVASSAPPAAQSAAPVGSAKAASSSGKTVSGVVEVVPALAARVAPEDTLFVFARAAQGPRLPLAIVRAKAKDLPLKFTLDDSSAMSAGMNLSSQERVVVGARISKSGNATPQPGDLEGLTQPVEVGKSGVSVTIDAVTK